MYDSWLFTSDLFDLCTTSKDQLPATFSAVLPHVASSFLELVGVWGQTLDGSLFRASQHARAEAQIWLDGWGSSPVVDEGPVPSPPGDGCRGSPTTSGRVGIGR